MRVACALVVSLISIAVLTACRADGGGNPTPAPGVVTHLQFSGPSSAIAGTPFTFTLTALDAVNQVVASYSGTVHFSSSDSQATLPADARLIQGTGTFQATLMTAGDQIISADDAIARSISRGVHSVAVSAASGFAPTGSMAVPRHAHSATLLANSKVLVVGGLDATGQPLATAELFDPASGTFAATGSMAFPRFSHTATLLSNGKVLIVGGGDTQAEIFDPGSGTFAITGTTSTARSGHTATLLKDGRVLVAGGGNATAELFDPASGVFTPVASQMAASRVNHTATLLSSGKVLVAGGNDPGSYALGELFDPATNTFVPTSTGATAARLLTATLFSNDSVLLAGGEVTVTLSGGSTRCCVNGPVSVRNTSLFENSSATFTATSDLSTSRAFHTATLLNDGTVLITGGSSVSSTLQGGSALTTSTPLGTTELFDVVAAIFTAGPNMTTPRTEHTATLLPNGSVLLIGGVDASGNVLASAELYQ
ncbi:MAG TPA: kelch repeat-containing protein [Candidatus Limnocylindrales bacterium]|nr:kelch repeat-containing protein [Candidatus Limnocylindrales bacterium]